MATTAARAVVRSAGEGERRWFAGGGLHIWKATAEQTGGAYFVFEDRMDAGKLTPLHCHPADEVVVVLQGAIVSHIDGEEHVVEQGGVISTPRGVPHAFRVLVDDTRLVCLQVPGDGDAFYRGASDPVEDGITAGPVDFDRVRASGEAHGGVEMLGPPPFPMP